MRPHLQLAPAATPCPRDVSANRPCLRCGAVFLSEGFGERIRSQCKASTVWRTSLPAHTEQTRRRSANRSGQGAAVPRVTISHVTTDLYRAPVIPGSRRLMLRPRETRDFRRDGLDLDVTPAAWIDRSDDMAGTATAIAHFLASSDTIVIEARHRHVERAGGAGLSDRGRRARHTAMPRQEPLTS